MKLNAMRLILYAVFGGIAVVILLIAFNGCARAPQKSESFAMDTVFSQTVYTDDPNVVPEVNAVFNELDALLSKTRQGGDVWNLNHAGGAAVGVSPQTAALLARCVDSARQTNGAYNPAMGAVTALWGIGTENERVPGAEELAAALAAADYKQIDIADTDAASIGSAQIDLGGSAKGYALDAVKSVLEKHGVSSALVTAGGSVLAYGEKPDGAPWHIAIRDPLGTSSDYFATIDLRDACVSTSGSYERGFWENGVYYHHILDPKTGYPAQNGLVSVTVVDENGTLTDIYSTALFVMGPAEGLRFANENGIGAAFVTQDGEIFLTDGFDYDFTVTNDTYRIAG